MDRNNRTKRVKLLKCHDINGLYLFSVKEKVFNGGVFYMKLLIFAPDL